MRLLKTTVLFVGVVFAGLSGFPDAVRDRVRPAGLGDVKVLGRIGELYRSSREHLKKIGANYLLNVGPDGLGRIPAASIEILRAAV